MFIRQSWYVIASSDEVARNPFRRVILNEPIVLYRKESGRLVALEDRCCHRSYPLSGGLLLGDRIQCGYHGMIYDDSGACVEIPWQKSVPSAARVRKYPVVERWKWIWVWMGDPSQADEAKIPDFHWLDDPEWGAKGTRVHVRANYQLIVENLLDLTHLAYVHRSTIGNPAVAEKAEVKFERSKAGARVTRWTIDAPPPPTYAQAGKFKGNVDRWQIIEFTPPAFVRLDVGACDTGTGAPEGRRVGGIRMRNLNAITPESEKTTHYFWAQAHDFDARNQTVTDLLFEQIKTAFLEDKAVFEAQQENMDLMPTRRVVNLSGDAGGIAARNLIEQLVKAEASGDLQRCS